MPNIARRYPRVFKETKARDFLQVRVAASLSVILAAFSVHASWVGSNDEDSYISFRYARNLLDGNGLVFNPGGEHVEGITNLLWTLFLAGGSGATGLALPTVALVLGGLCGALNLFVVYVWCRRELREIGLSQTRSAYAALAVPAVLALGPGFTFYSVSGLETPLFALLITGGLFALTRANNHAVLAVGGTLLGAATITRPDGVLIFAFGLLLCAFRYRSVQSVVVCAAPGFAMLAGVTLWRLWYYGSPLPNTFFAKAGGIEVMKTWGLPYLMDAAQSNWFQVAFLLVLGGMLLDRAFLGRNWTMLALSLTWCAYVVYVGGDYMPGSRFFVPILPVLYTLALAGSVLIGGALRTRMDLPKPVCLAILYVLVFGVAGGFAYQAVDQVKLEATRRSNSAELVEYRFLVADWVGARNPNALVAANAVGAFGYRSNTQVLDMPGLNEAEIAHHGHRDPLSVQGHQVGDASYVLSRKPDYIIPLNMKPEYQWDSTAPYYIGDKELAKDPEFERNYELVRVRLENGDFLSIFEREQ